MNIIKIYTLFITFCIKIKMVINMDNLNMKKYQIRTDLAIESVENISDNYKVNE